MHTLDAKININHCHLASYNSVVFTHHILHLSHKNCLLLDIYNTESLYYYLMTYFPDTRCFCLNWTCKVIPCSQLAHIYAQKFVGKVFHSHYNAFVIKSLPEFVVVNLWSLIDYRPLTVKSNSSSSDCQLFAILPYYY